MNRRNFFGNLGVLIAAAAAPTIFIPKTEPVHWGRPLVYVPKRVKLKAVWSAELEQDLMAYHNINVEKELRAMFMEIAQNEINQKFPGKKVIDVQKCPPVIHPVSFVPYYGTVATIV